MTKITIETCNNGYIVTRETELSDEYPQIPTVIEDRDNNPDSELFAGRRLLRTICEELDLCTHHNRHHISIKVVNLNEEEITD